MWALIFISIYPRAHSHNIHKHPYTHTYTPKNTLRNNTQAIYTHTQNNNQRDCLIDLNEFKDLLAT